ncbi:MAG: rod shape-determining protein MreD [Actinobacteria bacterium]|nr:MAG: rod shape-determining protein MreD [Actinomycetota bacterium]
MTLALGARLAALALGGALLEIVAVSQVSVFGGNADLSPLLVMAAGLLCGSVAGATVGFATGLFLDLALVQTLGLSSLVLLAVGYWAGRLRELRDPQGPFAPLAIGALATLGAEAGYAIVQFLLGVDAPVSWLLAREIVTTVLVNALIALPVYVIARRWLEPSLPDSLRRRRRPARPGLSPLS